MPLSPISYPMVNGVRTDHSSIQARLNARSYAVKAINWDEALDPAAVMANDPAAIGWTRGTYKPTFNFELWKAEADQWEQDLFEINGSTLGIMEAWFTVNIFHRQESQDVNVTEIQFLARITKISSGSTAGNEHHSKKYDCVCTPLITDGRFAYTGALTGPTNFGVNGPTG